MARICNCNMEKMVECLEWILCYRVYKKEDISSSWNTSYKSTENIEKNYDLNSEINGIESQYLVNTERCNNPGFWKCLSGNIHPIEQSFCQCINKETIFQNLS